MHRPTPRTAPTRHHIVRLDVSGMITRWPVAIAYRVYSDFLMPSRLSDYRELLSSALGRGYAFTSVERYWQEVCAGTLDHEGRHFVLRHDVDTDPGTAGAMWEIERSLGITSSFYFRRSTLDLDLMAQMAAAGSEVSYHYEELAAVAKRRRPKSEEALRSLIPEAQRRFRANITRLREVTGLPMTVVAAHGDFVNRRFGIGSNAILFDPSFREELGIVLDTRDPAFLSSVTSHQWDTHYPRFWIGEDPQLAIDRGDAVIYLLVHPRHWRVNRAVSARDNAQRFFEGLAFRIPARRSAPG
jgi:hypothetical protein